MQFLPRASGLTLLLTAKSSVHEILAAILILCGLLALVGIGIINAVDRVTERLPEPPVKPQPDAPV